MNDENLTRSARHPNFSRDLISEPFSAQEWAELLAWQEAQAPLKTLSIPARACVVCRKTVPVVRRADSTTCSRRCAATLRQRVRRKAA
jgi:hypothetical protein